VSAIVAATADSVRSELVARTLAAGFSVQALTSDPAELAALVGTPADAWVVTGGTSSSAQPFVRIAQAHEAPVVAVISGSRSAMLLRAAQHPATAILARSNGPEALRVTVAAIRTGLSVWDVEADSDREPVRSSRLLSPREREVLGRVAAGLTTKAIARQLGLSPNTVKFHLQATFDKLAVTSRAEAVVEAIRRGELAV
jgi:DNA-binding NarL/FixJ family response regulator